MSDTPEKRLKIGIYARHTLRKHINSGTTRKYAGGVDYYPKRGGGIKMLKILQKESVFRRSTSIESYSKENNEQRFLPKEKGTLA